MESKIEEQLNSYHKVISDIRLKQSYLAELKDKRGLKASKASEVHVNNTENIDIKITVKICDLEEELNNLQKKAVKAYENVTSLIDTLDNDLYKKILYARFINFKSWGEIAADISYSTIHLRNNLYKNAIKNLKININ